MSDTPTVNITEEIVVIKATDNTPASITILDNNTSEVTVVEQLTSVTIKGTSPSLMVGYGGTRGPIYAPGMDFGRNEILAFLVEGIEKGHLTPELSGIIDKSILDLATLTDTTDESVNTITSLIAQINNLLEQLTNKVTSIEEEDIIALESQIDQTMVDIALITTDVATINNSLIDTQLELSAHSNRITNNENSSVQVATDLASATAEIDYDLAEIKVDLAWVTESSANGLASLRNYLAELIKTFGEDLDKTEEDLGLFISDFNESIAYLVDGVDASHLNIFLNEQINASTTGLATAKSDLEDLIAFTGEVDDKVTTNITQTDYAIEQVANRVTSVEGGNIEAIQTKFTQTAESILAVAQQYDTAENLITNAQVEIEDAGVRMTATERQITDNANILVAQTELLSNQWSLKIQEDYSDGSYYAIGMGAVLYPDWEEAKYYELDDFVWFDENTYKAVVEHTATATNYPTNSPSNWELVEGGVKSQIGFDADQIYFRTRTNGEKRTLFIAQDDTIYLNGNLVANGTIAAPMMMTHQLITWSLKSEDYTEATSGFYINALTGKAEFNNIDMVLNYGKVSGTFYDSIEADKEKLSSIESGATVGSTWEAVTDPNDNKPADGADVTGDNTSGDTLKVAGTTAATIRDNLADAKVAVAAMESDGIFSIPEKLQWQTQWPGMQANFESIRDGAELVSVSVTALESARNTLYNFLATTHGVFLTTLSALPLLAQGDLTNKVAAFYKAMSECVTATATAYAYAISTTNLIKNTEFLASAQEDGLIPGWDDGGTLGATYVSFALSELENWSISGIGVASIHIDHPSDLYRNVYSESCSCTEGLRYGASMYTGQHYSKCQLRIQFFDADGAGMTYYAFTGDPSNDEEKAGGTSLSGYKRIYAYGTAPVGAVSMRMHFRQYAPTVASGNADSWAFYCRPQLSEWGPDQTTPPDYVAGANSTQADLDAGLETETGGLTVRNVANGDYAHLTAGDLDFWYKDGNLTKKYQSVNRIQVGSTTNGVETEIDGIFRLEPTIIITPESLQSFNAEAAISNQYMEYIASTAIETYEGSRKWKFTPSVMLNIESGSSTVIFPSFNGSVATGYVAGSTDSFNHVLSPVSVTGPATATSILFEGDLAITINATTSQAGTYVNARYWVYIVIDDIDYTIMISPIYQVTGSLTVTLPFSGLVSVSATTKNIQVKLKEFVGYPATGGFTANSTSTTMSASGMTIVASQNVDSNLATGTVRYLAIGE